jgi:RNA recognition motif-containing protein
MKDPIRSNKETKNPRESILENIPLTVSEDYNPFSSVGPPSPNEFKSGASPGKPSLEEFKFDEKIQTTELNIQKKLKITNLTPNTTPQDLELLFKNYGFEGGIYLETNTQGQVIGFVEFPSKELTIKAKTALNGSLVNTSYIIIEYLDCDTNYDELEPNQIKPTEKIEIEDIKSDEIQNIQSNPIKESSNIQKSDNLTVVIDSKDQKIPEIPDNSMQSNENSPKKPTNFNWILIGTGVGSLIILFLIVMRIKR